MERVEERRERSYKKKLDRVVTKNKLDTEKKEEITPKKNFFILYNKFHHLPILKVLQGSCVFVTVVRVYLSILRKHEL